jgi:putative methionine-R-sulfoxide reductase with GAF domain
LKKARRASRDVVADIQQLLAAKKYRNPNQVLEEVVELLYSHRRYFWIGLYLVVEKKAVRVAYRGLVPPCHEFALGSGNAGSAGASGLIKVTPDVSKDPVYSQCFLETKSEMVVPIKIAQRVLGVIDVESDRLDALRYKDQIILRRTAGLLARYLSLRGSLLTRKLRAANPQSGAEAAAKLQPESDRAAGAARKMAAGATTRL